MNEINTFEISDKTQSLSSTNSYIILPKQTYRILGAWYMYVLTIAFLVIGFTFLAIGIKDLIEGEDFNIHNFILFIVLLIIACLITYFFPFYASITVDMLNRSVVVKKYKLFFIIKKETKLDTTDIIRAYTEENYLNEDGKNEEDGFNLVFELKNGEKILALEGESNKNFEMLKIGYFLSKFFPGSDKVNSNEIIKTDE